MTALSPQTEPQGPEPVPDHPKFQVSIPADKAQAAAKALRKLGVDFNPRRDMIVLGHTDTFNDEANGHDGDMIRDLINEFLEDRELQPAIPKGKLNLQQLHELLKMAHAEFYWHNTSCVADFLNPEEADWTRTIRNYPNLMQLKDTPGSSAENTSPACDECGHPAQVLDTVSLDRYCQDCAGDHAAQRLTDDQEFQKL